MAKKVESEEERLRRILLIRDYILKKIKNQENFSTRSIAKYFTENEDFSISNNTVDAYINSLEKIDPTNYLKIRKVLEENKPKTIADDKVKKRIKVAVDLLLQDYTVEQIATLLEESPNTISRDLNNRLSYLNYSKEELEVIKNKLTEHSNRNLKNQNPKNGRNH